MFKITNPFGDGVKNLSPQEKAEYLDMLCELSQGRSVPNKIFENNNENLLTQLAKNAIITYEAKKDRYWASECGKWYLYQDDFDKLLLRFSEAYINELIDKFIAWKNPSKLKRSDIYRTLLNWGKDSALTGEQSTFITKSFDAYIKNTEITGDSIANYHKVVSKLFEKGYTVDDLRQYWKKVMPVEINKSDVPKYRRYATTVMSEFENWKKVGD